MDSFIVITLVKVVVVFATMMTTLLYLQWVERKVIAHIQVRPGPYRVGPHGLFQPIADVIKLITKEDLIPPYVNKPLYLAAPFIAMTMALLSISVIPFGPIIEVAGKSIPKAERIVDGSGRVGLRRKLGQGLFEPSSQIVEQRPGLR